MNQEQKNARFKLAHHRVIARALKQQPGLLEEARAVVREWKNERDRATFVEEWDFLLSRSMESIRSEIVRRTPEAERLRSSSPFALTRMRVLSPESARRLRRLASRPRLER